MSRYSLQIKLVSHDTIRDLQVAVASINNVIGRGLSALLHPDNNVKNATPIPTSAGSVASTDVGASLGGRRSQPSSTTLYRRPAKSDDVDDEDDERNMDITLNRLVNQFARSPTKRHFEPAEFTKLAEELVRCGQEDGHGDADLASCAPSSPDDGGVVVHPTRAREGETDDDIELISMPVKRPHTHRKNTLTECAFCEGFIRA